ncbi:hypothetical protein [Terribacillus sp. 179-K 1B1 HS]|uniref:hypothetical protein n=1 Tax=Terribacillus sp. 179-K 1B1 HS TaxID=3142388 RepID=UPI0039A04E9D
MTRGNEAKLNIYPIAASFGIHGFARGTTKTITEINELADWKMYNAKQQTKAA